MADVVWLMWRDDGDWGNPSFVGVAASEQAAKRVCEDAAQQPRAFLAPTVRRITLDWTPLDDTVGFEATHTRYGHPRWFITLASVTE